MFIIYSPPAAKQLLVYASCSFPVSSHDPRFVRSDEVHHADTTLEMPVCGHILIITAWGAVVAEAQPVPILEVHVEQALISTIEADATLGQGQKSVVIAHVGGKN